MRRTSSATRTCRGATSRKSTACSATTATLAEETGATLLIVSDHGFLWHEGRPRVSGIAGATAALWHREEGLYALWGKGIEPVPGKGEGNVGQVAATIMALLRLPRAAGTEGPALAGAR